MSKTGNTVSRWKRWTQFGLRTFLICAVAVGTLAAWIGNNVRQHARETNAIQALKETTAGIRTIDVQNTADFKEPTGLFNSYTTIKGFALTMK